MGENSRLRNLKKLAEKQVNEETQFDKEGKEIPKVELGDVEWEMEHFNELQNQRQEEDEIDDLYYEVKTDEEFVENIKQRKKAAHRIGIFNKK